MVEHGFATFVFGIHICPCVNQQAGDFKVRVSIAMTITATHEPH